MCAAEKSSQSSDPIHRLISVVQSHACRCYPASSAPWNVYKHLWQRGAGPVHNFVKSQLDHHWLSATAENRPAFPRLWARVCVSVTPSLCACVYPGCVWVLHPVFVPAWTVLETAHSVFHRACCWWNWSSVAACIKFVKPVGSRESQVSTTFRQNQKYYVCCS